MNKHIHNNTNRHDIKKYFALRQVVNNNTLDVNTANWTDQTPEGLAKFVKKNIPDWKQLIIVKNTIVIDPQKKNGDKTVCKKQSCLMIGRTGMESLCVLVDQDLTKNGEIPQHIRCFFGEHIK